MKREIIIPVNFKDRLFQHLFQNDLEQGAFLFAEFENDDGILKLTAKEMYTVPPEGWDVQMEMYLQMSDAERAKILKMARDKNLALIDCHSHPHSGADVWFSGSDVSGITDFASYVNWKLGGKPFAAMVWGEASVDAIAWHGAFDRGEPIDAIHIGAPSVSTMVPKGSWFHRRSWKNRYEQE